MSGFLASVSDVEEALLAARSGADIIDLKNPNLGALGAISAEQAIGILAALSEEAIVSATIGDLPLNPELIIPAVEKTAALGVDMIKIGLFPEGDLDTCLTPLKGMIKESQLALIGVLFADQSLDITVIATLVAAGFKGVMLDTSDKSQGSLTELLDESSIAAFIHEAKKHQILCGLAGSLQLDDIERLHALEPDYLGFRGALCYRNERVNTLDSDKICQIRDRFIHLSA